MRCVEGGRDNVTAESQVGVGSSNLGQGLATAQGRLAASVIGVGSHFAGDDVI